jgi:hypothetical protein
MNGRFRFVVLFLFAGFMLTQNCFAAILFQESFEDSNFGSRGWYDVTGGRLSTTEHIAGSTRSFECNFLQQGQGCNGGSPGRRLFAETDSVYVSFWIKYSPNWTGSNKPYHPHQFYLLTNLNGSYDGLAWTHLTAYVEENGGIPLLGIQDGQNIDRSRIGQNLSAVTETRAVAGCNGDSDGYGNGSCYPVGSAYWNWKQWLAGGVYFSDTAGVRYKNDWHHVEAYFKLNGISNGKAMADGVVRYWFDNELIINHSNVMLRTGQYPNMKFNQLIIGPWMGDGSPVAQTFWMDDLIVRTERPVDSADTTPPGPPARLRIVQ